MNKPNLYFLIGNLFTLLFFAFRLYADASTANDLLSFLPPAWRNALLSDSGFLVIIAVAYLTTAVLAWRDFGSGKESLKISKEALEAAKQAERNALTEVKQNLGRTNAYFGTEFNIREEKFNKRAESRFDNMQRELFQAVDEWQRKSEESLEQELRFTNAELNELRAEIKNTKKPYPR